MNEWINFNFIFTLYDFTCFTTVDQIRTSYEVKKSESFCRILKFLIIIYKFLLSEKMASIYTSIIIIMEFNIIVKLVSFTPIMENDLYLIWIFFCKVINESSSELFLVAKFILFFSCEKKNEKKIV